MQIIKKSKTWSMWSLESNKPYGRCVVLHENGDIYEGYTMDGIANVKGRLIRNDGAVY